MSKPQTLALARSLLRAAHQFADYNFRECVARLGARLCGRGGATLTTAARRVLTRWRPGCRRYAERRVLQGFREHAALKARAAWARRPLHASGASRLASARSRARRRTALRSRPRSLTRDNSWRCCGGRCEAPLPVRVKPRCSCVTRGRDSRARCVPRAACKAAISKMYTHTASVMPHQPAWRVKPPLAGERPGQA